VVAGGEAGVDGDVAVPGLDDEPQPAATRAAANMNPARRRFMA
jgi:hypothetical protein